MSGQANEPSSCGRSDFLDDGDDRLFKFKNRYIIHAVKRRSQSNSLVIVFSGVDATSSFCRMSHYGLREHLDANVVHVMDNFGAHGCYLLSIAGDQQIRNAVISLIRSLQNEMSVCNENTYLVGTSKGGTTAIVYALMIGGGTVIAGEPQVRLGDFVYNPRWRDLEQWRSLAYAMLGRVCEEDRAYLNEMIADIAMRYGSRFSGKIIVHCGNTGYWENHVSHLCALAATAGFSEKVVCLKHSFSEHNDVVPVFSEALVNIFHNKSRKFMNN